MLIWCQDFDDKTWTDAIMCELSRFRGIALNLGNSVADRFPPEATITVRSKREPTDFFTAGSYRVISDRLRRILESYLANVEFLPVRLINKKSTRIAGDWFCLNLLEVSDCLDKARSQVTYEGSYVTRVEKLVIDEDRCSGRALALLKGVLTEVWLVHEELATAIKAARCTGVDFCSPEEWRDPAYPRG